MVAASSANNGSSSATAKSTTSIPPGMPPPREVARPVVNLGSTCYMNAVLQALAHAPELCLAMDVDPHHVTCPIAKENRKRRAASSSNNTASPTSSPEGGVGEHQTENDFRRNNTKQNPRKLRRSSRKSPTVGMDDYVTPNNSNNNNNDRDRDNNDDEQNKYCALCEMEWHLQEVHSPSNISNNKDKPVAPSFFVHGFIDHVAPWFKLGQQEDSHEFLRLLIDAMQRSCKNARPPPKVEDENNEDAEMLYDDIPNIGEDSTSNNNNNNNTTNSIEDSKDVEYPFKLFRGTVESCVTCASCGATSSTLDPIEDIGLEVTSSSSAQSSSSMTMSTRGGGGGAGSPGGGGSGAGGEALADVNSAFQRFARIEELDAGYKCEKCGNSGRATKQSRLASIPPILTLHLKRFRYGATDLPMGRGAGASSGGIGTTASRRSTSAKSGSAKIEGHIKFEQIFNLKPYLTAKLQEQKRSMFCRLFAVIVHAGKNSHSGHYVAYVRNVSSNEWWKMDDARVTMASIDEVMNAEAYMLFYRVLDHPVAVQLEDRAKKMKDERKALLSRLAAEAKAEEEAKKAKQEEEAKAAAAAGDSTSTTAAETEKENVPAAENKKSSSGTESPATKTSGNTAGACDAKAIKSETRSASKPDTSTSSSAKATPAPTSSSGAAAAAAACAASNSNSNNNNSSSRKRGLPTYSDGKSWAKANTRLKTSQYTSLRSAEEYINENVQFKPEFFKRINEEGSKPNAKMDQCPIKRITGDDVVGGYSKFSLGLKKTIHRIAQRYGEENGESLFTAPVAAAAAVKSEAGAKSNLLDKFVAVGGTASQDDLL